jgi:flagellar protein FlbT
LFKKGGHGKLRFMALVIDLKPNEKVLIGSSVITNDKQRTRLRIDGDAPILREKDTMNEADATTPARKLYFTIQSMYTSNADKALEKISDYFERLNNVKTIAPHIEDFLNDVSIEILQGTYYKALKLVQDLINAENGEDEPKAAAPSPYGEKGGNVQSRMEAQLLNQSADQLQNIIEQWDTLPQEEKDAVITYNRKLWMVFFDNVNDKDGKVKKSGHGEFDITMNIINLYNYIYKQSAEILKDGDKNKISPLIQINRETAKALVRF